VERKEKAESQCEGALEITVLPTANCLLWLLELKRLAARKTGFDIVPPFNLIALVSFPAEQDDAAVAHRGKIDQSLVIILELDTEVFQPARVGREGHQQCGIPRSFGQAAAAIFCSGGSMFGRTLKNNQAPVRLLD